MTCVVYPRNSSIIALRGVEQKKTVLKRNDLSNFVIVNKRGEMMAAVWWGPYFKETNILLIFSTENLIKT